MNPSPDSRSIRHVASDFRLPQVLPRPDRRRADDVGLRLDRDGPVARRRRPGDVRRVLHQPGRRPTSTASARRSTRPGFAMPMLCCSPDFTNPDADARKRAVDREAELIRVARRLGGPRRRLPRPLRPALSRGRAASRGWSGSSSASSRCCRSPASTTSSWAWRTTTRTASGSIPSSPRRRTCSSNCSPRSPTATHFGVQYDPSNAIVAGDDPIELLQAVADRVVSMHASDRYLAEGATLDELRQTDGTLGYSPNLRHGVTGKGLNDYDAIFRILAEHQLPRLGQHRGRHERHGRDGRVAGVPAADGREVFPGGVTMKPVRTALDRLRQGRADPRRGAASAARVGVRRGLRRRAATGPRRSPRRYGVRAVHRRRGACSREVGPQAVVDRHAAPAARRAGDPGGRGRRPRPGREAAGRDASPTATPCSPPRGKAGSRSASSASGGSYEPVAADEAADRRRQDRPAGPRRLLDVSAGATRPTTGPTPGAASGTPRAAACWSTSRRTSSTCCSGSWAPVDEVSGYWANLNHPTSRWRTRPWRSLRFRSGGLGLDRHQPVAEAGDLHQGPHPRVATARRSASRPTAGATFIAGVTGDRRAAAQRPLDDPRRGAPAGRVPGRGPRAVRRDRRHDALPRPADPGLPPRRPRGPAAARDRRGGPRVVEMFTAIYRSGRERRLDCTSHFVMGHLMIAVPRETWQADRERISPASARGSMPAASGRVGMKSIRFMTSCSSTTSSAQASSNAGRRDST